MKSFERIPAWVWPWVVPLCLLALMQWRAGQLDVPRYWVAPTQIAATLWELLRSGDLLRDAWASLQRAYGGFAIGASAGVLIGLLCGVSKGLRSFFDPLVSLLYPVPKVALLPIIITWLGFGDASKVAVIAVAVFFPTFINSLYGALAVRPRWIWAAKNLGAGPFRIFWGVIVPSALPQVFNGLRSGLALSFIVLFAAEMVGARAGLGHLIMRAEEGMRFDWMYAAIFSIGLIGFASDRVLLLLRRWLLARKFPGESAHG